MRIPRPTCTRRVRLQGTGQLRVQGLCEGQSVSALPDSASDVSLISLDFARRLGKSIDRSKNARVNLELPGRRIVRAYGLVRDVAWSFGAATFKHDFYVMRGLPADLLLEETFLEHTKAFEDYADLLYEKDNEDDRQAGINLIIRRVSRKKKKLSPTEEVELDNVTHC